MNTPYPIVPKKVGPDCCIPGSCQGIIDLVAANIEVQPIVGMHGINGPSSKPTNPDPAVAWINDADGQLYIADVTQSKWKRDTPFREVQVLGPCGLTLRVSCGRLMEGMEQILALREIPANSTAVFGRLIT